MDRNSLEHQNKKSTDMKKITAEDEKNNRKKNSKKRDVKSKKRKMKNFFQKK